MSLARLPATDGSRRRKTLTKLALLTTMEVSVALPFGLVWLDFSDQSLLLRENIFSIKCHRLRVGSIMSLLILHFQHFGLLCTLLDFATSHRNGVNPKILHTAVETWLVRFSFHSYQSSPGPFVLTTHSFDLRPVFRKFHSNQPMKVMASIKAVILRIRTLMIMSNIKSLHFLSSQCKWVVSRTYSKLQPIKTLAFTSLLSHTRIISIY